MGVFKHHRCSVGVCFGLAGGARAVAASTVTPPLSTAK